MINCEVFSARNPQIPHLSLHDMYAYHLWETRIVVMLSPISSVAAAIADVIFQLYSQRCPSFVAETYREL